MATPTVPVCPRLLSNTTFDAGLSFLATLAELTVAGVVEAAATELATVELAAGLTAGATLRVDAEEGFVAGAVTIAETEAGCFVDAGAGATDEDTVTGNG